MTVYNRNFELDIEDIDMIEGALRDRLSDLSKQSLSGENAAKSKAREIHDLLGRLHDQKVFYRPKSGAYVGG